jgi:hypothetical protein
MKTYVTPAIVGLIACIGCGGHGPRAGQIPPAENPHGSDVPRVVRLAAGDDGKTIHLGVNGKPLAICSQQDVSNRLEALRLRQGDVVLLEKPEDSSPPAAKCITRWALGFCASNQSGIFMHGRLSVKGGLLSVPIYHWAAPYDEPWRLEESAFYFEGKLLGRGLEGFDSLLTSLKESRWPSVIIIGARHNPDWGFPPWDYETKGKRDRSIALNRTLDEAGTKRIWPSELNWW